MAPGDEDNEHVMMGVSRVNGDDHGIDEQNMDHGQPCAD